MPARAEIMVPLRTEVLRLHGSLVTRSSFSDQDGTVVHMDVRRLSWERLLLLPRGTRVYWSDVREVDIRELSSFSVPIRYRITIGDGWYVNRKGERVSIQLQPHLPGIDLLRECTTVSMRAAILLAVLGGVGLRRVAFLMSFLFHFQVSKSALARWIAECSAELPDGPGIAKLMNDQSPIVEAHFDELFPKGKRPKQCRLVLRDQNGRIFASKEIPDREKPTVVAFLQEIKSWGITPLRFFVDGCVAYRDAILEVFPGASIQYDYFHIIQNIWKKLRKAISERRRLIKSRSKKVATIAYAARLKDLATRLWENRWLMLKAEKRLTAEQRETLDGIMSDDKEIRRLREFALAVWSIFEDSETPEQAREALANIRERPEVKPKTVYDKSLAFLESRFEDMITYLKNALVQRNSLAETGMRCLRRLERGHDGFRNQAGFDNHLRIYQAVMYCGWTVHRPSPYCHTLGLMPREHEPGGPSVVEGLRKAA